MKLFLHAHVLVAVLNKVYPVFSYAARIVSLADNRKYTLYTSPICLAIAFYFAEKKCGTQMAKNKIALLVSRLSITPVGKNEVLQTLQNKKVNDFEDGLEYYAALNCQCDAIITEATNDFYFSSAPVYSSAAFLQKLMA